MSSFAILVDSGTDVPASYQADYPIYTAPLSILYPEGVYADRVDIQPEQIYARPPSPAARASKRCSGAFMRTDFARCWW